MKQIEKNLNKALKYKQDLENWNSENQEQPPYSDSTTRGRHYLSIFYNLLLCQDGLCAYSECRLAQPEIYSNTDLWKDGQYVGGIKPAGSLDHYDPGLKANAKAWEWDNFFVVNFDLNSKVKRRLQTSLLIKPDNPDYSPEKFFNYNLITHQYELIPDLKIPEEEKNKIDLFLEKILNWEILIADRKAEFRKYGTNINWSKEYQPSQFPTAFKLAEIS